MITINLNNLNDNAPVITDATVALAENSANGTVVYDVNDGGNDTDADGQALTYTITAGNGAGGFAIDAATGVISVANSAVLDYETTTSFVLTVQASDGSASDTAVITINLNNLNDNAPVITDATVALAENSANGTVVYDVNDGGNDTDADGQALTYTITAGNGAGGFAINAATGVISVANSAVLDYETTTSFVLTVQASDGSASDTADITINLNNLNDNAPVITDATVALAENSANGTVVYDVNDGGNDTDADGQALTYTITAGNGAGGFAINAATGVISVANSAVLDYETTTSFVLTVQASDGSASDTADITINLNNLNDNAPVITDATVALAENSANGTVVYDVNDGGNDTDADGQALTYTITAGNGAGGFAINAATGVISVANSAVLDYETTTSFVLTVQASDGSASDTADITINLNNLNDNAPVITDATVAIAENSANGTVVYDVNDGGNDTDADGQALTYTITAGNGAGGFAINAATGVISVANSAVLDYETTTSFVLTVQASDGSASDTADITINLNNLNDNAPVITDATVALAENSANGTVVYDVNDGGNDTDADGQALTYTITAGNGAGGFAINAATGVISVANSAVLDYETTTSFVLTVQASDGSASDTADITINLNNLNDNAPVITDATVALAENSANGTVVYDVNDGGNDTDADGQALTYTITAGNGAGGFAINAATGVISVANSAVLDYETTTSFVLTVQASDGSASDTADITINLNNLNDNAPVITDATVALAENSANGTVVYDVNDGGNDTDADGQALTYTITAGNGAGGFAINAATGVISVANSAVLDYETTTSFVLTVQASDGSASDTADITINLNNLNDNAPVITDATVAIAENSANGTVVYDVNDGGNDTDADGQALTYTITAGNGAGGFALNAATGVISVANSAVLDYETTTSFVLTVQASDGSASDTADITINLNNLNDNAPVITDATVAINENSANGTVVYDLNDGGNDTDADGQALTYTITAGNGAGGFALNAATGVISVANSAVLDYETTTSFVLTVQASDGSASDTADITINLNNLNDNAPVITDATVAINENSANGTVVYDLNDGGNDTDADGQALTYTITAGNGAGGFALNAATGVISVANSAVLDYETTTSFVLTVQASDGSASDTADITINLNNLNDNAPVITDATVAINENSANGTVVYDLNDGGNDTDADGQALTYTITAGNGAGGFALNAATGVISVANSAVLDYETTTSFVLTVQASDGSASDTADITINLNNLNDNAPVITDATVAINENSANGTVVYDLNDGGNDTDADGQALTYTITAGNGAGGFALNAATGVISVANSAVLDYETTTSFVLTVQASDGSASDTADITINLNNLNDNAPVITDATVAINENSANGTVVYDLNDGGNDTDADGQALTYTITAGNGAGGFALNAATGVISVANSAVLDYETTTSFVLTVQASDGSASDTADITINLNNLNDNAPVITDATVAINENSANGTVVYDLNDGGNDTDADGQALTYTITAGNGAGGFALNAATGVISVANSAVLDYETTTSFVLTVQASDGSASDTADITINLNNLNDNAPVITDATVAINENSANGTVVYDLNDGGNDTDADGQALTYTITAGNGAGGFALNAATGVISVANSAVLDYETTTSFVLTVQASDGSASDTADITINLNNLNDNAPVITDATVALAENSANGTVVYDVNDGGNDTDADGQALTYTITAGNGAGGFAINAATGVISVANSAVLDYETTTSFVLTVQASDGSSSDTADITINLNNLNDNAPVITDATVALAENSANGTVVYDVNDGGNDTDADGQALTYTITAGNGAGGFAINAATGVISVANSAVLDYETTTSFVLTVQASDGSSSDTADITINLNNLNDNAPVITDATVALAENSANGTVVYDVNDGGNDTDADGQALTYTITAGNGAGGFAINAATGVISVANSAVLDYETTTSFVLTVQASDGSSSDTADITINLNNLNDNAPVITDATVALAENSANGTVVYDVNDGGNDTDADGQALTYTITAGNGAGGFAINAATGVISVANSAVLDYETTTSFVLTVQASDGSSSDTADITINLNNLNDNAPVITDATVALAENSANGTVVYDVNDGGNDTDADGQALTYTITAGNGAGGFAINAATGVISVANSAVLDYETTTSFVLTVQASDGSSSDTADITINLNNLNEAPLATNLSVPETYTEDTPLNLTDIVVTDVDSANVTVILTLSDVTAGSMTPARWEASPPPS